MEEGQGIHVTAGAVKETVIVGGGAVKLKELYVNQNFQHQTYYKKCEALKNLQPKSALFLLLVNKNGF
uniref:Uncharacterized protein n=1 Tax=Strongyloides venezuelensis TaxID=75913 RepID=A0A0K0EVU4_STRVS